MAILNSLLDPDYGRGWSPTLCRKQAEEPGEGKQVVAKRRGDRP